MAQPAAASPATAAAAGAAAVESAAFATGAEPEASRGAPRLTGGLHQGAARSVSLTAVPARGAPVGAASNQAPAGGAPPPAQGSPTFGGPPSQRQRACVVPAGRSTYRLSNGVIVQGAPIGAPPPASGAPGEGPRPSEDLEGGPLNNNELAYRQGGSNNSNINSDVGHIHLLHYSGVILTAFLLFPMLIGGHLLSPDVVSLPVLLLPAGTAFSQALAVPDGAHCCCCFPLTRQSWAQWTQRPAAKFKAVICSIVLAPVFCIAMFILKVRTLALTLFGLRFTAPPGPRPFSP